MAKSKENAALFDALDDLQRERGIPKDYMLERLSAALVSAYKKAYSNSTNVKVVLDPEAKECRIFRVLTVVDEVNDEQTEISLEDAKKISKRHKLGTVIELEIKTKEFSRTSAHTAKQVIIQGIRDAERGMLIKEYENKKEEIMTATVVATELASGAVIVNTGTSEVALTKSEQIPGETFKVGDLIKVFVTEVNHDPKPEEGAEEKKPARGRVVTISRIHPGLVKRLFELEVPEIADGTVIVKNISREAGSRTKMAVYSRNESVDPIGACIGNRGARIAGIVDELKGEKIDIIKFSETPEEYISAALSPAVVKSIYIDDEKTARVTVAPDQLSLAIGKEGQNARLAARLTGYKIDIKPE